jgi:hypothetical protein
LVWAKTLHVGEADDLPADESDLTTQVL